MDPGLKLNLVQIYITILTFTYVRPYGSILPVMSCDVTLPISAVISQHVTTPISKLVPMMSRNLCTFASYWFCRFCYVLKNYTRWQSCWCISQSYIPLIEIQFEIWLFLYILGYILKITRILAHLLVWTFGKCLHL